MIKGLIITILCSLGFRIRGGLRIKGKKLPLNKYWFALIFSSCYCYLTGWNFNKWFVMFIASRLSTQLYGWGEYVGCCLGASVPSKDRGDCELVDDIVDNMKFTFHDKTVYLSDYPITWGWLGLSLRGLILSFIIGLAMNSIPFMLCGFAMGTIYYLCGLFSRKVKPLEKCGWNAGEFCFGAYLGVMLWLLA